MPISTLQVLQLFRNLTNSKNKFAVQKVKANAVKSIGINYLISAPNF